MDNNVPEEGVPTQSRQRFGIFPKVALAFLVALLPFLGFYLGTVYTKATSCPIITYPYLPGPDSEENCQEIQKQDCPVCPTTTSGIQEQKWATADMGAFSFSYPTGWHIANVEEVENAKVNNFSSIVILHPTPINLLPHGGPLGAFEMHDTSGSESPEKTNAENIANFKKGLRNVSEETIDTKVGKAIRIAGEADMYAQWRFIERYFLLFQGRNSSDSVNKHAMYIENFDSSLSDELRALVTSISNQ